MLNSKVRKRLFILIGCALLLCACAEPTVEQTRYDYRNSIGQLEPITYKVASAWEAGNGNAYYIPGVERNKAKLSVDVSPAKYMKETLREKLYRITSRGQTDKDRHVLTTTMTTVNGHEAIEYAEQGEAYKPPEDRYFTHEVEFIAGPYLIRTRIRGHSSYYPELLQQLWVTADSIHIAQEQDVQL